MDMTTQTRQDALTIARALAQAIEQSDEIEAYRRTEQTILDDPEAIILIREYELSKRAVKKSKHLSPIEQLPLLERFMTVEAQFNEDAVIQSYWNARTGLDAFMDRVNAVVTFPFTGEDAPKIKGGCGSGGSCGCS
jgi:cell fate (sporulation/competence/biofilm development) regulator YlbF (YheA/YmcA/DUF963 family)